MMTFTAMPKYEAYKSSGVEWLGNVPSHWVIQKMKFLFTDTSIKNKADQTLLSVTQDQGVVPRDWVENRMVMPSGNLESFKYIQEGDFAISLRSFEGGLEYCHHDGIISPAYTVLKKNRDDLVNSFYKYLFKSQTFISELQTSIVGIREGKNISYEELRYSYLPIPKKSEQTAIANFLDEKTAKIDEAITIKEKQIELLKERKQIIIQQAVTQGLDPTVPMKDSGVEWIGKIPEHWIILPLTKYSTRVDYRGKTPEKVDEGIFLITTKNIKDGVINYAQSQEFIKESQYKDIMSRGRPQYGDILFTMEAPLGASAIIDNELVAIAQRIIKFRVNSKFLNSEFVNFFMQTSIFQNYLQRLGTGSTALGIKASKLFLLRVTAPDITEQEQIIEHVKKNIKYTESVVFELSNQIEKLKEYKTTLINSAVTGKIKVV